MLCVNAPRKAMARIHMLISLVLVIVCAVLAFTPLMKIVVTQETVDSIEDLMEYVLKQDDESGNTEKVKKIVDSMNLKDASVELSITGFASAAEPLTDASSALSDLISAATNSKEEGSEEKAKQAAEKLKSIFIDENDEIRPEVRDLVVVVAAIAGPMLPSGEDIEGGMSSDDLPAMLGKAIPHIIGMLIALLLTFLMPIIFAILTLVSVITALRYLRESDIGAAKLAKRMPKSIVHSFTLMLIPCLSATIAYTNSVLIMAILAAVGTLVNVIFTRLHSWEKQDIAYANVVQATSLVSIGAYLFLFLNILKMGVFRSFIGKFISAATASGSSIETAAYTDMGMILIAVFFALLSSKYMAKVLRRISLACTPKSKGGARSTHLVNAIFLLAVTVFPMMALGSTANGGGAFLTANPEQEYALLYGFIATCVMILSEIVLLILKGIFGKKLTPEAVADVMSGVSVGPDKPIKKEKPAKEAPVVAEEVAPAEAEEDPFEEPQAEEPAEEPVAEPEAVTETEAESAPEESQKEVNEDPADPSEEPKD